VKKIQQDGLRHILSTGEHTDNTHTHTLASSCPVHDLLYNFLRHVSNRNSILILLKNFFSYAVFKLHAYIHKLRNQKHFYSGYDSVFAYFYVVVCYFIASFSYLTFPFRIVLFCSLTLREEQD
jgi:hypothetical protein